jgi:hypothetical protein
VELGTWVRIEDGSLADGQVGRITRLPGDAPRGYAREGDYDFTRITDTDIKEWRESALY